MISPSHDFPSLLEPLLSATSFFSAASIRSTLLIRPPFRPRFLPFHCILRQSNLRNFSSVFVNFFSPVDSFDKTVRRLLLGQMLPLTSRIFSSIDFSAFPFRNSDFFLFFLRAGFFSTSDQLWLALMMWWNRRRSSKYLSLTVSRSPQLVSRSSPTADRFPPRLVFCTPR